MKKINKLEKELGIKYKNKSLLIKALTHKSANIHVNNEKLEFLGDRVIGLTLSKKLFDLYPNENEGVLDKRFARLVNRKTCCEVAWSIGIQNYVILADTTKKVTKSDEKILSDCCEALIGSIYIDRGFDFARDFILKIWKKKIDKSNVTILDPKTKLQEYSLKKFKKLPVYQFMNVTGPKHNPVYKISVSITGHKKFNGFGNSKQQAEQDGAAKLIKDKNII